MPSYTIGHAPPGADEDVRTAYTDEIYCDGVLIATCNTPLDAQAIVEVLRHAHTQAEYERVQAQQAREMAEIERQIAHSAARKLYAGLLHWRSVARDIDEWIAVYQRLYIASAEDEGRARAACLGFLRAMVRGMIKAQHARDWARRWKRAAKEQHATLQKAMTTLESGVELLNMMDARHDALRARIRALAAGGGATAEQLRDLVESEQ